MAADEVFSWTPTDVKERLESNIQSILETWNISQEITLEKPPREMGDMALPCFNLARELKKNPIGIAQDIERSIMATMDETLVEALKVKAKGPYVNFTFRDSFLLRNVMDSIIELKDNYGLSPARDERVILEHTSANPNGPFHVGRARNPIIGDTMARLLRKLGFRVEVQYWVNDMGRQAATLAWGKTNIGDDDIEPLQVDNPHREKPDHVLVRYYQEAHKRIQEESTLEREIDGMLYDIERGNKGVKENVRSYSEMVLSGMKESLFDINVDYDRFVWESASVEDGTVREVIDTLRESEHAHSEEEAMYLELEPFGISGRSTKFFFTRSDGTSLYTTRDLAYHLTKLRSADMVINVLGEDHKLQARQLAIALGLLGMDREPESIFYSFVSLAEGKMSTRKGQVVFLDDLITEALHRALLEVRRRRPELDEKAQREIARVVGIGCIRYNIIRVQSDKRIVFRWEDALNFEGDSSPFLQYAHARCSGILRNAGEMDLMPPGPGDMERIAGEMANRELHPNERKLMRVMAGFPDAVEEAGSSRRPHLIPKYLQELASAFNIFYQTCPVLKEEEPSLRALRLALVDCTRIVLAEGLGLLGIVAPDSM